MIPQAPNFTDVNVTNLKRMFKQWYGVLVGLTRGSFTFDNPIVTPKKAENFDSALCHITTPGVANTDFLVAHNLNRIPQGYLVLNKDRAVDVYNGSGFPGTWDVNNIQLRATVISAVIWIEVF